MRLSTKKFRIKQSQALGHPPALDHRTAIKLRPRSGICQTIGAQAERISGCEPLSTQTASGTKRTFQAQFGPATISAKIGNCVNRQRLGLGSDTNGPEATAHNRKTPAPETMDGRALLQLGPFSTTHITYIRPGHKPRPFCCDYAARAPGRAAVRVRSIRSARIAAAAAPTYSCENSDHPSVPPPDSHSRPVPWGW